jgi:hypothetical protein
MSAAVKGYPMPIAEWITADPARMTRLAAPASPTSQHRRTDTQRLGLGLGGFVAIEYASRLSSPELIGGAEGHLFIPNAMT